MPSYQKKIAVPGKLADVIYQAVSDDIDRFLSKSALQDVTIARDADKKTVSFKASMASGSLLAKDGVIELDLSLSFLALPFKSKIDDGIEKWIHKTFA